MNKWKYYGLLFGPLLNRAYECEYLKQMNQNENSTLVSFLSLYFLAVCMYFIPSRIQSVPIFPLCTFPERIAPVLANMYAS